METAMRASTIRLVCYLVAALTARKHVQILLFGRFYARADSGVMAKYSAASSGARGLP